MQSTGAQRVESVITWLADGARSAETPPQVLNEVCERLVEAGVPVWRVAVFVRTLHPDIMGRRFLWQQGQGVKILEAAYDVLESLAFRDSPVAHVTRTGERLRIALGETNSPDRFPVVAELRAEGATDYLVSPLIFTDGSIHVATWTTRRDGGFDADALGAIDSIVPALARVAEIRAQQRTSAILLDTYVGRQTGERILAGQVRRGYSETIAGAVWLSDLRGFTVLADTLPPPALLELLNRYFDCQVPAILAQGGEVLKFMGDGLLAIFPLRPGHAAMESCERALAAARDAEARVAALASEVAADGGEALRFGLALHFGEFLYGNVGGGNRLDFTCIGPAINLAARLEKLTGQLQRSIVASEAFASHSPGAFVRLGDFALAGFKDSQAAYGLA